MSSGSRILLTGGAGFIGSHLAEALVREGASVTIIDNMNNFYPPAWKENNLEEIRKTGFYQFYHSDICDMNELLKIFVKERPEIVIHLAAYAGVRPSIQNPRLYEDVNISGTGNLLEAVRELKVRKFIFGSSSSVYGNTCEVPFREDKIDLRPISPYAATKLSGELLAYTYAHLFDISTVSLRFFTVYGPRQRPDLAIRKFVALLEAGNPIPVFGDGTSGRDYTHVSDIVTGLLAALRYEPTPVNGARYDVFNLGNSSPVTLDELLKLLELFTGKRAFRTEMPAQPGDVSITWADIAKSTRFLGYQPKIALARGLEDFVRWYRSCAQRVS
jgi:UDP-glucuronate 4-epimerase